VQIWVEKTNPPMIWLGSPRISEGRFYDRSLCAKALGLETNNLLPSSPQFLNAGNPTLLIALKDKAAVDKAWLGMQA